MKKKIILSVLLGAVYWVVVYILAVHGEYLGFAETSALKRNFSYLLVPFILGAALLLLTKENKFIGFLYPGLMITVYFAIQMMRDILFVLPVYDLPMKHYSIRLSVALGSAIAAMLGGVLAVFINRISIKKQSKA